MDGRSEKPDGMQDPRRTEVGSRVDPGLAKGFVKQMLKRAEHMSMMLPPAELGEFRNPKVRFRAIQKLIATVASKDSMRVAADRKKAAAQLDERDVDRFGWCWQWAALAVDGHPTGV